jgi:hypothetical protein
MNAASRVMIASIGPSQGFFPEAGIQHSGARTRHPDLPLMAASR